MAHDKCVEESMARKKGPAQAAKNEVFVFTVSSLGYIRYYRIFVQQNHLFSDTR